MSGDPQEAWAEIVIELDKARLRLEAAQASVQRMVDSKKKIPYREYRAAMRRQARWLKKVSDLTVIELNLRRVTNIRLAPSGPRRKGGDA
jgi:hypothetical protein